MQAASPAAQPSVQLCIDAHESGVTSPAGALPRLRSRAPPPWQAIVRSVSSSTEARIVVLYTRRRLDALIHFADERLAIGSVGSTYITLLHRPLTVEGVAEMRYQAKRIFERTHGKHVTIAVIEPSAASPASAEVRAGSAELAREFPILGAAIVLEGSGFRPAATRTLIAGMYLVTRKAYPHKIFENARDGAAWLGTLLTEAGVAQPPGQIVEAVEQVRAAIKPAS